MPRAAVGVAFRPTTPPERLHDIVGAVETAGLDELWLWEDCFSQGGFAAAAAALAWSRQLTVGIGLLPAGLRNPALVAMEIATLARLFPERFTPGTGHGPTGQMSKAGITVSSPMTLLREHFTAVHGLLHGRRVDVDGRETKLRSVALDRPPVPPPPPLPMGARGDRTLRLAGELAEGVILGSIASPDVLCAATEQIDAGRAAAGRDDAYRVVVYVEPSADLTSDDLTDVVHASVRDLGDAGATSVIFVNHPHAPDPMALVHALTARTPGA